MTFRCLVWRTGGFRRQYKFTISKTQWKMNMKLREKRNQWWVMMHKTYIYIYYYTYTIVQYIYELCHYMMFVYLLSVRFWKISCDIQDLRSSICRSWTNTSAHPLRYPRPVMKRRLGLPRFPSHINIKVLCSPRKWGIHNVRRKWNAVVWCFDKWTPASTVQFRATFHFLHFPKNSCSTNKRKLTKITNSA